MTTRIEVTQQDIDAGHCSDPGRCPIALAVARAIPGKPIHVDGLLVGIGDGWAHLPPPAVQFVRNFDFYVPVKPFSFEI